MSSDDDVLFAVALLSCAIVAALAVAEYWRGAAHVGVLAGAASACASVLVLIVPGSLSYRFYVSLFVAALAILALRRSRSASRSAEQHKHVLGATRVLLALEVTFNVVTFFATQFLSILRSMGH